MGRLLLSKFKWGAHFYPLNEELLSDYKNCISSSQVVSLQQKHIQSREEERNSRKSLRSESVDYFSMQNDNRSPALRYHDCASEQESDGHSGKESEDRSDAGRSFDTGRGGKDPDKSSEDGSSGSSESGSSESDYSSSSENCSSSSSENDSSGSSEDQSN